MTRPLRDSSRSGLVRACQWLALALLLCTHKTDAQVIRGRITVRQTEARVIGARVSAHDSAGLPLHEVFSDSSGHFTLKVDGRPFSIAVRKLGWQPSFTELIKGIAATDTVEMNLEIPAEPPSLSPVEIVTTVDAASLGPRRLQEARRRGWQVFEPEFVASRRADSPFFADLMRAAQVQSILLPQKPSDCVRSMRNNRCLTYIVDDQVIGYQLAIQPSDVYFFAVLTGVQSSVMWGDRAPYGAIVIYTRMYGDRRER